ncbi:hypothetical protein CIK73_17445, partial [Brachybacterium alimentarium]
MGFFVSSTYSEPFADMRCQTFAFFFTSVCSVQYFHLTGASVSRGFSPHVSFMRPKKSSNPLLVLSFLASIFHG